VSSSINLIVGAGDFHKALAAIPAGSLANTSGALWSFASRLRAVDADSRQIWIDRRLSSLPKGVTITAFTSRFRPDVVIEDIAATAARLGLTTNTIVDGGIIDVAA
jgi:hypothetical protein